jgi:hypothetical protein
MGRFPSCVGAEQPEHIQLGAGQGVAARAMRAGRIYSAAYIMPPGSRACGRSAKHPGYPNAQAGRSGLLDIPGMGLPPVDRSGAATPASVSSAAVPGATRANSSVRPSASGAMSVSGSTRLASGWLEP